MEWISIIFTIIFSLFGTQSRPTIKKIVKKYKHLQWKDYHQRRTAYLLEGLRGLLGHCGQTPQFPRVCGLQYHGHELSWQPEMNEVHHQNIDHREVKWFKKSGFQFIVRSSVSWQLYNPSSNILKLHLFPHNLGLLKNYIVGSFYTKDDQYCQSSAWGHKP